MDVLGFMRVRIVLLCVIVVLGFGAIIPRSMANQDDSNLARDSLLQAKDSMLRAFAEAQEANRAGADVTAMKENLTTIQTYLENAQTAYDREEFQASTEYSQHAITLANSVVNEAIAQTALASERINTARFTTIASFIIFDFVLCIVGLYVIKRIQRHKQSEFLKKIPKM
jgi:hypothetical protein